MRPESETGHSRPLSPEVKNLHNFISTPLLTPLWRDTFAKGNYIST